MAGDRPRTWQPQPKALPRAADADPQTFEILCEGAHDTCDAGLEFQPVRSISEFEIDYATLNGFAYEPATRGQAPEYWTGSGWRPLETQLQIDYREQGSFAPVQGSGLARWTYRFAPIETSRIRVVLREPRNPGSWKRVYAIREMRAAAGQPFRRTGVSVIGSMPGRPEYLQSGANLATPEAGAEIKSGSAAEIRWPRAMLANCVRTAPASPTVAEWWDGAGWRPVETVPGSPAGSLRFLPVSATRLRVKPAAGLIQRIEVLLDDTAAAYAREVETARFDLLGTRFRGMPQPDLNAMRGLLLPLDFAKTAIGRPADLEETHVTWNGTFLMVENVNSGGWISGEAKVEGKPDRHDRWFSFATGPHKELFGTNWPDTSTKFLDDWLPATVTVCRRGALTYQQTLFVTAPGDPLYGTAVELVLTNHSNAPTIADLALVLGRRHNHAGLPPGSSPMSFDPEVTGYRLDSNRRTVRSGSGGIIVYADTPAAWSGTSRENHLAYRVPLQAGESRALRFLAPSVTEPLADDSHLAAYDWGAARQRFRAFWETTISSGMKLELPEPQLNLIYKNLIAQSEIITLDGDRVKYGAYSYEDYFGVEEGWPAVALAQYGHSELAKRIASLMLSPRLMDKTNYHHQYRNGLDPWYAITIFRLTHDIEWLKSVAPALREAAEWTIRMIHENQDAKYGGILPKHAYGGDIHMPAYSFYSNATCWRGLHDTALAFRILNQPELAVRYQREADNYHQRLSDLADQLAEKQAGLTFLPTAFEIGADSDYHAKEPAYEFLAANVPPSDTWTYLGNFWNLFAPLSLEVKLFDAANPRSSWVPQYMEARGGILAGLARFTLGIDQIYGKGYYEALLEQGRRQEFRTSLYGVLAHGMSGNLYSFPEVSGVFPLRFRNDAMWEEYRRNMWDWGFQGWENCEGEPLSAGPGMALQLLRMSVVREILETTAQDTLRLLDGAPPQWFDPGKKIAVRDAPTFFGKISFETEAFLDHIAAHVSPVPGFDAKNIILRLAGSQNRSIRRVTVSGKPWTQFDGPEIQLPVSGTSDVIAYFE